MIIGCLWTTWKINMVSILYLIGFSVLKYFRTATNWLITERQKLANLFFFRKCCGFCKVVELTQEWFVTKGKPSLAMYYFDIYCTIRTAPYDDILPAKYNFVTHVVKSCLRTLSVNSLLMQLSQTMRMAHKHTPRHHVTTTLHRDFTG